VTLKLIVTLSVCLAACGGEAAQDGSGAEPNSTAQAANNGNADLQDLSKFRLTMDRVDKYYVAQKNVAVAFSKMSPEEREAAQIESNNDDDIDEMTRNVESKPVFADAIRKAGLSAREYTMITIALFQSMMAASVVDMHPVEKRDSIMRDMQVIPENVKFVKDNQMALQQKHQSMEAEMKALEAGN
jgi:hypothetical protein